MKLDGQENKQQLIYDLPTRVFHWAFALLFACSFLIAKVIDDDNPLFSYHMILGFILSGLVVLRVLWGVIGTKYARFSSFALRPNQLITYLKNLFSPHQKTWTGHNPASSWAALIMMFSALALAASGILMITDFKKSFEEIHEIFANIFLIAVIFHIVGVLFHSIKHQDGITLAMITGKKQVAAEHLKISSHKMIPASLLLILLISFASYLFIHYNSSSQQLNFFGNTLLLKEHKKHEKKSRQAILSRRII